MDKWLNLEVRFNKLTREVVTKKKKLDNQTVTVYLPHALYKHVDVLKWWKENAHEFPSIALMARVYLSRELTSSYQERIFSNGGFVCNDLRSALHEQRCEKMILAKANCDMNYERRCNRK